MIIPVRRIAESERGQCWAQYPKPLGTQLDTDRKYEINYAQKSAEGKNKTKHQGETTGENNVLVLFWDILLLPGKLQLHLRVSFLWLKILLSLEDQHPAIVDNDYFYINWFIFISLFLTQEILLQLQYPKQIHNTAIWGV